MKTKVYFSDFFEVSAEKLDEYGAFNISLINDLPLFIDPFLLFGSDKPELQEQHREIINYLSYLRELTVQRDVSEGLLKSLYRFPEIKQNWLGLSVCGNSGRGLGLKFARALNSNLEKIFTDFGSERITESSHLEKLCIISEGVGRDCISDFTTNLILPFLLKYTEEFSLKNIAPKHLKRKAVPHSYFDYNLERWMHSTYTLPSVNGDFVILTPKEILSKDDAWINCSDMINHAEDVVNAQPDEQLREHFNVYLSKILDAKHSKKDETGFITTFYRQNPVLIDYYIKRKEVSKEEAKIRSKELVTETEDYFVIKAREFVESLLCRGFYNEPANSLEAARRRIVFMKDIIENQDGYRYFYVNGKPLQRESDLQIMYRLTWFATAYDVNREVNNGRGPVDYKISNGSADKSLVEFKLASNSKLKQNLLNQVAVYEDANNTKKSIKVILCFTGDQIAKCTHLCNELELKIGESVYIIDASNNKVSASNVKS